MSWCSIHEATYYGGKCDECEFDLLPTWMGKVPAESKRPQVKIQICKEAGYTLDDKTALEMFKWWKEKVEDVPAKYIPLCKISISSEREQWGDDYNTLIGIYYYRPQNVAEYRRDKAIKKYRDDKQKVNDRKKLAELKAKLGET